MMYSIKYLLNIALLGSFVFFSSCNLFEKPNPIEPCQHEVYLDGHYLEMPISFIPYKEAYQIGDTVTVSMTFQDSIYDQGTRKLFKIENMRFRPFSILYRFYDDFNWDSGLRVNSLIIDTLKYQTEYTFNGSIADNIRSDIFYNLDLDRYEYSFQIVFKEIGKYIFHSADYLQATIAQDDVYHALVQEIDFEGKCQLNVGIYNVITHEGHYIDYKDELVFLDTAVLRNKLTSFDPDLELGSGTSSAIENNAFFCFEVVE